MTNRQELIDEGGSYLSKTNRVVTGKHFHKGKGLGQPCRLCNQPIEKFPYLSHLVGGSNHTHYYHLACAKKLHML